MWNLDEAQAFCAGLEHTMRHFNSPFSVCLLGSVLYKGFSTKDLDIGIFPLKSQTLFSPEDVHPWLERVGMVLALTPEQVKSNWRSVGSKDEKLVERWYIRSKRIDVFYFEGQVRA